MYTFNPRNKTFVMLLLFIFLNLGAVALTCVGFSSSREKSLKETVVSLETKAAQSQGEIQYDNPTLLPLEKTLAALQTQLIQEKKPQELITSPTADQIQPTTPLPEVSESPFPSDTPQPTNTSTSVPDTASGSVLGVGDEWRQNGVGLRLTRYELNPETSWGDNIGVGFEFRNYTNDELVVSYSSDDFIVLTNTGESLTVQGFYNGSFWCNENTAIIKPGERYKIEDEASCGGGTLLWITADIGSPSLTEVIIQVTQFSRVSNAKWHILFQR